MKKHVLFPLLFLFLGSVMLTAQDSVQLPTPPDDGIEWETKDYDFGSIPQNVPAKAEFKLTNTGDEPLILTNVKGSCGCTATGYDKDPIAPGASTTITATYNARKAGPFHKSVRVNTNRSDKIIRLSIKGKVEAAEQENLNK